MNTAEYPISEKVMGPEMRSGSFLRSITAARGIPKLETGPQKWVEQRSAVSIGTG